ncbi:MAG: site-specific DNA-methyltransferase [Gammaproteobacteria bacterium]|nr:site-specific DNA-methyltransferase [Gammaproteobacteria bacterium]
MIPNRTLFAHDCLEVLSDTHAFPDNCIDLIYLDPPFNSKSQYNLPFPAEYKRREDLRPVMAFNDTWYWNDECTQQLKMLEKSSSLQDHNIANLVKLTKSIRNEKINTKDSMSAYLISMQSRLKQMRRVLKPTGSIYLHCDPTASHYLKLMLDNIFGRENFRNELIWHYSNASRGKKNLAKSHDIIFWYSKSNKKYQFNRDEVLVPFTSGMTKWRYTKGGQKGKPIPKGKTPDDMISIPSLNTMSKERLGYPTQKPLELLDWIIRQGSYKDDLILDPFCGCGTTVHAAEELGRQWIGIDISKFSTGLVRNRLGKAFPHYKSDIEIRGNPITIKEAVQLSQRDKFEFEKWVCGEIGAEGMYHAPGDRGADGGVDGIISFYHTREGKRKPDHAYSIVQVTGGKVTPDKVKALGSTIKQHKDNGFNAICGIFVCFEKYMQTVENNRDKSTVFNHLFQQSFDFIQPLSVEDLLKGKLPYLPGGYHKKAA